MTSARSTGGGPWMASNSSTTVRLSASIPGLEDDPRWRPTTSCPSPTANEQSLMKDGLPPGSSFSKGMLDDEWYIPPDNSLMDEMKELSYSSSLAASQQSEDVAPSAHFNLDSPHLQSFLSRNLTTTRPSFNGLDGRSNLSTFLDGPGGLSFDGSGGNNTLMSNFRSTSGLAGLGGGNVLLDTQNGTSNAGSLGNLLTPGLGSRGCVSNGLLLSNLSPRNGVTGAPFNNDGDGGGGLNAHHHHHHSLSGNLSSILTSGISNSFSNSGRISPLGHNSPYNSSSNTPRGLAAAPNTVLGNGCTTFASKRDGGFSNAMNLGSRNVLGGGGKDNNSLLLQSKAILPQLEGTTATTSSQAATGGGASAGGPATGGGAGTQQQQQQQQQHQTLFQKRAALRHSLSGEGMASPTIKSPTQVVTSGSNDSPVDMPDEESPNMTVDTTITTTPTAVTPTQTHNNNKSGDSSSKKARNNGSSNNSSKATVPSTEDGGGGSRRPPQPPPAPQQPSGSDEVGGDYGLDDDQRLGPDDGKDDEDDMDESGDGSGVLYETDDTLAMDGGGAGGGAAGGSQGGLAHGGAGASGEKGKGKKGLPAKNLMAERRRRKKLNDRLYLLRSVVPKITKMDRASILGDAIEYLKELLQRINDLHTELESAPAERPLPPLSPAPLPPPTPSLACRVKEETPHSLPSPDPQPARVEVRTREGRALNIHMFCQRKPGLLLSTMRALDGLGLDVQQAVISCFNGFALDVFKAEQSKETEVGPEEIRAVLLHAAGSSHNTAQ